MITETPIRPAEVASRKVMVSPEVMAEWTTFRTLDGYLVTMKWGEPDADGWYSPTFTRHADREDGARPG